MYSHFRHVKGMDKIMNFKTDMFEISMVKIQLFMKCIETKNYSRAASEFNYTPSMVSRTITSLENTLGLQLFIRNYHSLMPTPAAKELARIWAPVVEMYMRGIEQAHKIQEGNISCIKIGLLDTTRRTADYIMHKFEESLPDYMMDRIIWERRDMHDLTGMMENG